MNDGNFVDDSKRAFCRAHLDPFASLVSRLTAPAAQAFSTYGNAIPLAVITRRSRSG